VGRLDHFSSSSARDSIFSGRAARISPRPALSADLHLLLVARAPPEGWLPRRSPCRACPPPLTAPSLNGGQVVRPAGLSHRDLGLKNLLHQPGATRCPSSDLVFHQRAHVPLQSRSQLRRNSVGHYNLYLATLRVSSPAAPQSPRVSRRSDHNHHQWQFPHCSRCEDYSEPGSRFLVNPNDLCRNHLCD
jgi:hypothetical protein